MIFDGMAEGMTAADILDHYPKLTKDDIHAALAHAADLAECLENGHTRMKLKLDENLSRHLKPALTALGHDSLRAADENPFQSGNL